MKKRSLRILTATLLVLIMLMPYFQSVASTLYYYREKALGEIGDSKVISSTSFLGGDEKTGTVPPENTIYDKSSYYRYITTVTGITPPAGASSGEIYIRELKGHSPGDEEASFYCLDPTKLFPPEPDGTTYTSLGELSAMTDTELSDVLNKSVTVDELNDLINRFYYKESYDMDLYSRFFESEYKEGLINSLVDMHNSRDKVYQFLTDDDIKVAQQWALWKVTSQGDWGSSPVVQRDLNADGNDDTPSHDGGYKTDRNAMLINLANSYDTNFANAPINDAEIITDLSHVDFIDESVPYADYGTFRINTSFPNLMLNIRLFNENDQDITADTSAYEVFVGGKSEMGGNYGIPVVGPISDHANNPALLNHDFFIRLKHPTPEQSIRIEVEYITRRIVDAEIFVSNDNNYQSVVKIVTNYNVGYFIEEYARPEGQTDLALRKFITQINSEDVDSRKPVITQTNEAVAKNTQTTAHYAHIKQPLLVRQGDTVKYQINVYNESTKDAHLTSVIDVLPKGLSLKTGPAANPFWSVVDTFSDGRTVIEYNRGTPIEIPGAEYIGENYRMYELNITVDITIDEDAPTGKELTNIAFINYQEEKDIDSLHGSISKDELHDIFNITNDQLPGYRGFGNESQTLDQPTWYYKGYEDDDDFEKVILKPFDLALRKFITDINDEEHDREPVVDITPLIDETDRTTATYSHPKNPILVELGDVVKYKIRVYNEGGIAGYAEQIKDHLPEGLGFILNHRTNISQGWTTDGLKEQLTEEEKLEMEFLSKVDLTEIAAKDEFGNYSETENAISAVEIDIVKGDVKVVTDALEDQIIEAFNPALGVDGLSYLDVEIVAIVLEEVNGTNLKNWAEISEHADEDGNPIRDRDSFEDNLEEHPNGPYEDDEDFENLSTTYFDLALRKFITNINDDGDPNTSGDAVDREPVVDVTPLIDETDRTTAIYSHPKTPVTVQKGDLVTYTIRVYNEGMIDGYVKEIKDHIPKGLAYLPQHQKNIDNEWEIVAGTGSDAMIEDYPEIDFKLREDDLDGVTNLENTLLTIDSPVLVTKLRENDLIDKFVPEEGTDGLSYVDVQIVLVVLEDRELDSNDEYIGNLKNWAEISEFTNGDGISVFDRDSFEDNWNEHINGPYEDDEDFEDLTTLPMVFDLALQKFITEIESTAEARAKSPEDLADRVPIPNFDENRKVTYVKENTKPPLVGLGDVVTYTIRVYNEGNISGYAKKVRDTIPEGLTYLPSHEINTKYQWYFIDADGNEVEDIEDAKYIETEYLSRDAAIEREDRGEQPDRENTILLRHGKDFFHRDLQIVFRVNEKAKPGINNLKNIAEISDDEDEDGNDVDDIDSTPGNDVPGEDDIDEEDLEVTYFDLALLKIVTNVELTENGKTKNISTGHTFDMIPEPVVKTDLDERYLDKTQIKYTYKIRVFNEGLVEGYATKVADYIPKGLEFHPEDQKNNKWTVVENAENVVETTDLADVLLKPGEYATVELVLRWINHRNNMGVKTNVAEISEDHNEYDLPDIDSVPGNRKPGEDDIDDASVLVAIRTGAAETFFIVSLTMGIIVSLGTVLIRKYIV